MSVLFINTGYLPNYEEWIRLDNIQKTIAGWRAELLREQLLKKFSPGEIFLSKQRFHSGVRATWKILHNQENQVYTKEEVI